MAKIKIEKPNKVKTSKSKKESPKKKQKSPSKTKSNDNIKLILKDRLGPKGQVPKGINEKLNKELINLAIEGLFKLTKKTVTKKLFEEEYPIYLQINLIKVAVCPNRIVRFPLKKTLITDETEVCLIVPDLKKGRKVDYEPTIEHYENLLRENGVKGIKSVIPMNKLKIEYDQFELKRRLATEFDHFLVDGKISGHVSHLLGKVFYSQHKLPTPVHLNPGTMKNSIDAALKKTQIHIHSKGNSFNCQIGHAKMSIADITSNILHVAEQLDKQIPGGWTNIRSLQVKTHLSIAIPIYLTLKSGNNVETPNVPNKRPKLHKAVQDTLSTKGDVKITVLPDGDVLLPSASEDEEEDNF